MCLVQAVLLLPVFSDWVVENLAHLGPGSTYHLAYDPARVELDVLEDLREGAIRPGIPAEVVRVEEGRLLPVARARLTRVHEYPGYYRFDFVLEAILPYLAPRLLPGRPPRVQFARPGWPGSPSPGSASETQNGQPPPPPEPLGRAGPR